MSDNEYERFEITDYDLQNEFNPNRPRRRQTKHQQTYGIWADDSENDSEDELPVRRGRRGGISSKPKDYTAPVNFVAGGIQQAGKKDDEDEKIEDDSQITDEEDDRPVLGRKTIRQEMQQSSDSSEDEPERPQMSRKSSQFQYGGGQQQNRMAGMSSGSGMGSWERHTKGIGAKLLLQMGYEPGKGLGKNLQGIQQPVEAHLRKGRGAIGAYGPEKPASVGGQKAPPPMNEDEREAKEFKEKLNKWRKDDQPKEKRNRYYYRSVEEVIEKGKKSGTHLSDKLSKKLGNVTVIDMTGPEKRVLSGYHALGQSRIMDEDLYEPQQAEKTPNFALPELMHNVSLIVDMCEQDIIALDKEEREAADRKRQLEKEQENLKQIVQLERDHIETLEKALKLVNELTDSPDLTLDRAEKIFHKLQADFPNEYKEFGLGDLAAGVIAPLVKCELANWQPLAEPTAYVERIKKWKTILCTHNSETRNVFDPYSSLIWAGVVPSFRATAAEWNPKIHQHMAALLDAWAPLFPTWILDNVLEQLILPRLVSAVQEWDPLTDTIPIHIWILPWSGILGAKMEEFIYPTIREKLGNALQAWSPQDRSARAMLTPWKSAFEDGEMQAFMMKHIIPKLQLALNELVINPLQQDLELFHQVWEWNELISPLMMAQLLDKYFFPKWMQTLVLWLNQSPDFDQISRWYSGWKSMLSEPVLKQPAIKEHLRRALELMHRATETPQPVPVPQSIPTPVAPVGPPVTHPPALMDLQIAPPQIEFKELVSQRLAERGILFVPMPGRREFGKQVYRCGKLFCYIDRNVLMVSDGTLSNWTPTSLGLLLEKA